MMTNETIQVETIGRVGWITLNRTAALDAALETSLAEGLRFEQQVFAALFSGDDQKEGMAAFRTKRAPEFRHR